MEREADADVAAGRTRTLRAAELQELFGEPDSE